MGAGEQRRVRPPALLLSFSLAPALTRVCPPPFLLDSEGPVVEKYWKKCKTPLDRYAPGSKAYRAAKAAQASASPPKAKTKKRVSAGSDDDEAAADEDEKPKKRGRRSANGGSTAAAVADKKEADSPVLEDKEVEQDGELLDGEIDFLDDRPVCVDWEEKYGAMDSWEVRPAIALFPFRPRRPRLTRPPFLPSQTEVKEIETMEQDESDHSLRVCVVWQADDSVSWLDSAIVRQRAPQKLLDFFVGHLKWKKTTGDVDEDEDELVSDDE